MSRDSAWRRVADRALGRASVAVPDPVRPERPDTDMARGAVESICRAPSVSMYFDQFGKVRACCSRRSDTFSGIAAAWITTAVEHLDCPSAVAPWNLPARPSFRPA